jgi:hypothetical protein
VPKISPSRQNVLRRQIARSLVNRARAARVGREDACEAERQAELQRKPPLNEARDPLPHREHDRQQCVRGSGGGARQALKEKPELAEKITRTILEKVNITGGATVTGEAEA